jgi:hypothetical protein
MIFKRRGKFKSMESDPIDFVKQQYKQKIQIQQ